MTPRATDRGKGRVMTVDISPSQLSSLSPPWTSRSLAHAPPHAQNNFTQNADAFSPAAESTQPPQAEGSVPRANSWALAPSPGSQVNAETHE